MPWNFNKQESNKTILIFTIFVYVLICVCVCMHVRFTESKLEVMAKHDNNQLSV